MHAGDAVFGYARVSSKPQAASDRVSLPVQREKIAAHCREQGWQLLRIYEDHVSGRRKDRPAYQEMLAAVRRGEAKAIVCLFYERFGRGVREAFSRVLELEDHGVQVIATEEPDPPGDHGIVRYIRMVLAEQASDRISEHVRNAVAHRKAAGMHWGRVPYGWRRVNGTTEVHPLEAAVVRRMAELLLSGLSFRRVTLALNADGYRARGGQLWWPHAVGRFLGDPRYAGGSGWPPILDTATFTACGDRLARSRELPGGASRGSVHLLAGLLRCECGRVMIAGYTITRGKYLSRYYVCLGKRDTKSCDHRQRHAPTLEQAILDTLVPAVDAAVVAQRVAVARLPARDWAQEERQAVSERDRCDHDLLDNLRLYRAGRLSEYQFGLVSAETQARREAAEQRLRAIAADQAAEAHRREQLAQLPQRVTSLLDEWATLTTAARKARLQQVLSRVVVYRDGGFDLQLRGVEGD